MSLFGGMMGDFEDDPFFGSHLRSMRQMNNMMNSLFPDPFRMFGLNDYGAPALTAANRAMSHNSLMPFGFPPMPNINRLISGSLDNLGGHSNLGHSYSSTSVVSMTSGPDGRPQVYRASSSTRTAPGGIKETQRTVCDSRTGTKKMAIGHHIGERAHIIEKEHNLHSGDQEERQDFINIEEDEAEDFNREWETKATRNPDIGRITSGSRVRQSPHRALPAITSGAPSRRNRARSNTPSVPVVSPRRSIRPALALTSSSTSSSSRRPYSSPGNAHPRKHRNVKSVSGSPDL